MLHKYKHLCLDLDSYKVRENEEKRAENQIELHYIKC